MRILPSPNDEINEDWISDKARFMYDGLKYQRLMVPLILKDGKFEPIDWESALIIVSRNFLSANKNHSYAIAGQLLDAESLVTLRDFFHSFFCENIFTEDCDHPNLKTGVDFRCSYTMNNRIQDIENADVLLLVGICPRYESTLINARIRKGFIHNNLKVMLLGEKSDLTYPYEYVGNDSVSLIDLFSGNHHLSPILFKAKRPMILLGTNSSQKEFGPHLLQKLLHFSNLLSASLDNKDWKVFNSIQRSAGYVNGLDLGYNQKLPFLEKAEFIYLLGTDSGLIKEKKIDSSCFVVYQGHHGDLGAQLANIILPGSAYTEKSGTYVNTEGRAQLASRCVTPPGNAREDWKIIRALSEVCGKPLNYQTISEVRSRLGEIAPHFCKIGDIQPSSFQELTANFNDSNHNLYFENLNSRINNLADFYMTDSISRHSKTMAKCVFEVLNRP
ncbi:hypothetical protein MXB_1969 [Myxobolus squamalis]|nr:hypothetical protein MXB_1969 [Myxobolus squamalis]